MKVVKISGQAGAGKTRAMESIIKDTMFTRVVTIQPHTSLDRIAGLVAGAPVDAVFFLDEAKDTQIKYLQGAGYSTQRAYVCVEERL